MQKIVLSYDPYRMKTQMSINGIDVCQNENYTQFKEFIENGTPMQTWIESIPYLDWKGFVNEISDDETNDEVQIDFSGRIIDYEDLQRSITVQNNKRSEATKVKYTFRHVKKFDDKELAKNIEKVVNELEKPEFQKLITQRNSESLNRKYEALKDNYRLAQDTDFYIVFAGVYSSGKSTLLNAVIRHNVLPTSYKTCTSKNCRIRHDRTIGNKVSLTCYDENDNVIIDKQIFENDEKCAETFAEISPIKDKNAEDKYPDVVTMELGVNLSHLYPKSISEDQFNIVLIDTPGMDSAQSSENGINKHAEIALKSISMENKPMIILCVDGSTSDNKSIGEFMREIVIQADKEKSGFNDRFLFLMNKCDAISYNENEKAEEAKNEFAEYLTDYEKWNITADDQELNELSKAASHFVPRIFMTTGLCAYAIQCDALNFSNEQLKNDTNDDLKDNLEKFIKKICDRESKNFYLSRYCDIPDYRKNEIEKEFKELQKSIEKNDRVRAAELQCGLLPVEYAIKDYIERYAYPIKIRGVLSTFEGILEDVKSFQNGIIENLREAERNLGENRSEREGASERKRLAEEKTYALNNAKERIEEQQRSLNHINFKASDISKIIENFKVEIEKDNDIKKISRNNKIETAQKTNAEVRDEINNLLYRIRCLIHRNITKANSELAGKKAAYDQQLKEIYYYLELAVEELKKSGALNYGSFDFTKSLIWTTNFSNMNTSHIASDMIQGIKDSTTKTQVEWNFKKEEYKASWNPFKKFASLFMSDTISTVVPVAGYYETKPLKDALSDYFYMLNQESQKMGDYFTGELNASKGKVESLTKQLLNELESFYSDIRNQEKKINECEGSIEALNKKIQSENEICKWLADLSQMISEV